MKEKYKNAVLYRNDGPMMKNPKLRSRGMITSL